MGAGLRLPARRPLLVGLAAPLLRASFTAADGTAIASCPSEIGPALANVSGTWAITGNKAQPTALVGSQALASADVGAADVALGVTVRFSVLAYGGAIVRCADVNNFWLVEIVAVSNLISLYEVAATVATLRNSAAFTPGTGVDYRLVVTTVGQTITGYIDGVPKVTWTSAATGQTVTKHGIFLASSGAPTVETFDNLAIWRAGAVSAPGGVV